MPRGHKDRLHQIRAPLQEINSCLGVQKIDAINRSALQKINSHASGSKRSTPSKGELHCKNKIRTPQGPKDRLHQRRAAPSKINSRLGVNKKNRLHQMRAPTKREITVKNKYASQSTPTTSSNESTHQRDTKSKNKKRRTRTLKDKRPIITNFKQNQTTPHIVKLSLP